jgi:hypothetical protein
VLRSVLGDPVLQRDGIDTLLSLDTGEQNVGPGDERRGRIPIDLKNHDGAGNTATFMRRLGRDEASAAPAVRHSRA